MKYSYQSLFSMLFFLVIACKTQHVIPENYSIKVESILKEKISIRAVEIVNDTLLLYAGSVGKYGLVDLRSHHIKKFQLPAIQDSIHHGIRSVAKTADKLFLLTIESPAQLYQMNYDGSKLQLVYQENDTKVFYDSMQFWNNKEGIAIGDPTASCMCVITTKDGGLTWKKTPCSAIPKVAEGEAAFAASNTNLVVYKQKAWFVSGGKKSRLYHSENKGKSWNITQLPIVQGKTMTGAYSMDFYKAKYGMIVGGDWSNKALNTDNKLVSKNGGKTWHVVANGQSPAYRSCVQVVPHSKGKTWIAVGTPGISITYDLGLTWKKVSTKKYYTIRFLNDSIAYAAGAGKLDKLMIK